MPLTGRYEPSPTDWVRDHADRYEDSGGTEGATVEGFPIVLLTSVGAKSGALRRSPLVRVEHGGAYLAVASNGGPRPTRTGTTTSGPTRASSRATAP